MKLSTDLILLGLAAMVIGGGALALTAHSSAANTSLKTQFTKADQTAFDREFSSGTATCEVGVADQGICFQHSRLESQLIVGQKFPQNMYPLALEWRANLVLDRKLPELKTVRIGQTVVLMERDSRMIVDKMALGPVMSADTVSTTAG